MHFVKETIMKQDCEKSSIHCVQFYRENFPTTYISPSFNFIDNHTLSLS